MALATASKYRELKIVNNHGRYPVALHMGSNSVEASADYPMDGEAFFDSQNQLHFEMPPSCAGQKFCFVKGDDYPEDRINEVLDQMPLPLGNIGNGLTSRDGGDNPDCPANTSFIDKPIYYIVDENDQVRVVVQSPDKLQQIYSAKWCLRPGQITHDTPHFLKGSRTLAQFNVECVNTYMDLDFFVLTDEYSDLRIELAKAKGGIPVCCRCRYTGIDAY